MRALFRTASDDYTNARSRTESQSLRHRARNYSEWSDKLLRVAPITASARRFALRFEPNPNPAIDRLSVRSCSELYSTPEHRDFVKLGDLADDVRFKRFGPLMSGELGACARGQSSDVPLASHVRQIV